MNELKTRGVEDVLLAVVDGLKGFPEAITTVFPEATVQTCIVHLLRHSLDFVSWKDRKAVAAALKGIYRAVDAAAGEVALAGFEDGLWDRRYPAISQPELAPGLERGRAILRLPCRRPPDPLHHERDRGPERQAAPGYPRQRALPDRRPAIKLLFLVLNRSEKEWKMPPREWVMAKAQFGERFARAMAA